MTDTPKLSMALKKLSALQVQYDDLKKAVSDDAGQKRLEKFYDQISDAQVEAMAMPASNLGELVGKGRAAWDIIAMRYGIDPGKRPSIARYTGQLGPLDDAALFWVVFEDLERLARRAGS